MWFAPGIRDGGPKRFFSLAMAHESAATYYMTNFNMMQLYNYALSDIENMYPFEREFYIKLLNKYIEEKNRTLLLAQQGK